MVQSQDNKGEVPLNGSAAAGATDPNKSGATDDQPAVKDPLPASPPPGNNPGAENKDEAALAAQPADGSGERSKASSSPKRKSIDVAQDEVKGRKRDREGSVEPTAAVDAHKRGLSTPDTLPTKKNRLIEEEPTDEAPDSGKVGQIRRRVEELSYDEREAKTSRKEAGSAGSKDTTAPPPLPPRKDDTPSAIAKEPSSATAAPSTAPAPTPTPTRKQPTFASFSSSSSGFASSSASTGVSGPSWLAGSSSASPSPFASGLNTGSPKAGGISGSTGAIKPSALGGGGASSSSSSKASDQGGAVPSSSKASGKQTSSSSVFGSSTAKSGSLGFGAFAASKPFVAGSTSSPLAPSSAKADSSAGSTPAAKSIFDEEKEEDAEASERADSAAPEATESQADDESAKVKVQKMNEAELATGEENEKTVHSVRAKLYTMTKEGTKDGSWKERGTGTLRVNMPKDYRLKGTNGRLVMRAEGVLRLILNVALFPGMSVEIAQDKFIRFVAMEDGKLQHFAVKVSNGAAGQSLFGAIKHHIPAAKDTSSTGVPSSRAATSSSLTTAAALPSRATAVVFKDGTGEEGSSSQLTGDDAA